MNRSGKEDEEERNKGGKEKREIAARKSNMEMNEERRHKEPKRVWKKPCNIIEK